MDIEELTVYSNLSFAVGVLFMCVFLPYLAQILSMLLIFSELSLASFASPLDGTGFRFAGCLLEVHYHCFRTRGQSESKFLSSALSVLIPERTRSVPREDALFS